MASTSETGHYKNIANFSLLITTCQGFGSAYNPTNTVISIASSANAPRYCHYLAQCCCCCQTTLHQAVNAREIGFKPMHQIATRIVNALAVSPNVQSNLVDDARTILRKIRGVRASSVIPENAITISVSQRSFDMQYDHFKDLVALVAAVPTYLPNEGELQIANITTYKTSLLALNDAVVAAATPYTLAIGTRNDFLYNPNDCLVKDAALVKLYVKSIFGASDPGYKLVSGIQFKSYKL
jgi:hypothetical protein